MYCERSGRDIVGIILRERYCFKIKIKRKMATINYRIVGKKNPSEIRLRFLNGRATDIDAGIQIFVDPEYWDKKNQRIRNVIAVPQRDAINKKLSELKLHVFNAVNFDFIQGEILNRVWLEKCIAKFYDRPSEELKKTVNKQRFYLTDFASWWLDEKAPKFKVTANKYMDETTKRHYTILNNLIKKFEGKEKIRFSKINADLIDSFSEFLTAENYAEKTAKRMIGRFKFFCLRAESENIVIDQSFKNRVFVAKQTEEYKEPYLNEFEISKVFEHDFSDNETLDNVRDNLIIGLRTGLRVSDFLKRLIISDFEEDFIEIEPQKTANYKTRVTIPIHWMVRAILEKRGGKMPAKISDQKFNMHIKTIAKAVGFDSKMVGGVVKVDPKTKIKRKVVALYSKHELVTSHICRRSFATNAYGSVNNQTIMSICGWSSEEQMLDYIKMTNREHAEALKKVWDSNLKKAN